MHEVIPTPTTNAESSTGPPRVVAIFNSMTDIIDALREAFEQAGFPTITAKVSEAQSGVLDVVAFVQEHRPAIVVYDIPRPYEAHWNFLRLMRDSESLKDLTWIITTTDKQGLEDAVGSMNVVAIVLGKPYTIADVVRAAQQSMRDGQKPEE